MQTWRKAFFFLFKNAFGGEITHTLSIQRTNYMNERLIPFSLKCFCYLGGNRT